VGRGPRLRLEKEAWVGVHAFKLKIAWVGVHAFDLRKKGWVGVHASNLDINSARKRATDLGP
jgi:hypothetical protein